MGPGFDPPTVSGLIALHGYVKAIEKSLSDNQSIDYRHWLKISYCGLGQERIAKMERYERDRQEKQRLERRRVSDLKRFREQVKYNAKKGLPAPVDKHNIREKAPIVVPPSYEELRQEKVNEAIREYSPSMESRNQTVRPRDKEFLLIVADAGPGLREDEEAKVEREERNLARGGCTYMFIRIQSCLEP